MRRISMFAAALLCAAAVPASAQDAPANPQIDYPGFQRLTGEVRDLRAGRLIGFSAFKQKAAAPGALVLDARSRDAYARGHIAGAVNLPFTDFTAEALAEVIGSDTGRPILIYCNNNFSNNAPPVMLKSRPLALNIQTFINLVGYGYANVWELNEVVDFNDPKVGWVKG
ncbi:rhodanese-like domain-containing protein [Sphingomonas canadensis]|uniref:Rhodanese-like domain-containing protein n=1 Tax=Sphingomonas canadensis TaxID=1219257 RepID=A0ABW3HDQ5_9SPHN|nr:rhodanese-like domain-containing protein [Sphingomonas canadensis]MCW3837349.1 rhodanese-like domain-containing protein [Sphingomonas canadensis]